MKVLEYSTERKRVEEFENIIGACLYFTGEFRETATKHYAFKALLCDIHEDCLQSPKLARKCRNDRRKAEGW